MTQAIITYAVYTVIIWIHSDGWLTLLPALAVGYLIIAAIQYNGVLSP